MIDRVQLSSRNHALKNIREEAGKKNTRLEFKRQRQHDRTRKISRRVGRKGNGVHGRGRCDRSRGGVKWKSEEGTWDLSFEGIGGGEVEISEISISLSQTIIFPQKSRNRRDPRAGAIFFVCVMSRDNFPFLDFPFSLFSNLFLTKSKAKWGHIISRHFVSLIPCFFFQWIN